MLPQTPQSAGRGSAPRAPPFSCLSALSSVLPYHLYVRGAASVCVYCVNCTKFGQLILRIIIKVDATRCHNFKLKMHQNRFRLGLRPRPRYGISQRSPRPLVGLKDPISKGMVGDMGMEGNGRKGREQRGAEGKRREGRGRGGRGRDGNGGHPQYFIAPPVPVF